MRKVVSYIIAIIILTSIMTLSYHFPIIALTQFIVLMVFMVYVLGEMVYEIMSANKELESKKRSKSV